MATFEMQNDKSSLLPQHARSKPKWSTLQCVSFAFLVVIVSVLASNMDRIIQSLRTNNEGNSAAQNVDGSHDIIVVGAGPAGLLHTHLLQEYYPDSSILLIEQLNRTGGRQFSSTISYKGSEPLTFEQCAMRTPTHFVWTLRLLNYLGLCDALVPFDEHSNSSTRVYSRRNSFTFESELDADFYLSNYNLLPLEQSYVRSYGSPYVAAMSLALQEILKENGNSSLPKTTDEWNEFRNEWTLDGRVLNTWSFTELCRFLNLSREFEAGTNIHYPVDFQYFYLWSLSQWNGSIDDGWSNPNISFYTLQGGYDSMSRELASMISDHDANSILFGNRVVGVEKQTNNKYVVKTSQDKRFSADKVIFAIPAQALRAISSDIEPLRDDERFQTGIDLSMEDVACKLNLVFDNILLNGMNDKALWAISQSSDYSQDIRTILFENDWFDGNLSVITFYVYETESCTFWWTLQQSTQSDLYDEHVDDIEMDRLNDSIIASKAVVNEAMKQFKSFMSNPLVNITEINMPIIGFLSVWGADPAMGASVELPKVGVNVDELWASIVRPNEEEEIYIASSSFSWVPGFVEGAVQATVQNLQQNFGIPESALRDVDACIL